MATASVDIVIAGQNRAVDALNSAADGMRRMSQSARSAATAMKALVAVQVGQILTRGFQQATTFVTTYVKGLVDARDALSDVANRTGFAVESLQSLGWAAHLAGVENFTGGIQKFNVAMGKAIASGETKAFDQLGLDFAEIVRMSPDEQFRAVAEAISRLPTEAQRAAAAVQLFGKSGAELVPLFTANLAQAEAQARSLGMVLSGQQVAAIGEMNDALDGVRGTFEGIISQVAANLAPMVTAMANEFLGFVAGFQGIAGATGGNALADAITTAFFEIAATFAGMFDSFLVGLSDFQSQLISVVKGFQFVADIFTVVSESMSIGFNLFKLAGGALTEGFGMLLEGLGSWVSSDLEAYGKGLRESAAEQRLQTDASMDASAANLSRAASDAFFGREAGGSPVGAGPASQAVEAARQRFANIRTGPDPEAEAEARRKRELAAAEMQRQEMMKRRTAEWGEAVKDAVAAQKDLTGLIEERDQLESERAERMAARTPENQAVIDRFLSRGPQLDANQRTAAATEKLAELNQKIKEKQDAVAKSSEQTARNTANLFGMVSF